MNLRSLFSFLEQQRGLPPGFLARSAVIESQNDPNAHNKSGALGLFQFMPGTARQYGLVNPRDPEASAHAAAKLAADNAAVLTRTLGRAPTAGELYLAHQQGAGGASGLLTHPDAPAESIVGRAAVLQNGGHLGMTAGQFANLWTSKFGGPIAAAADQPIQMVPGPGGAPIPAPLPTGIGSDYAAATPAAPFPAPATGSPGLFAGLKTGDGAGIVLPNGPAPTDGPTGPFAAGMAADQSAQAARQMPDFLLPQFENVSTSGQPVQKVLGDAATNPQAAEGLFQQLFTQPRGAKLGSGGAKIRA